ncbi:MAG TPA: hypothetical protein VNO75_01570 [Gemmatimonadaceae bacterium]|nr:hypothetical protein [Gemmatimonadaceae bacterium]
MFIELLDLLRCPRPHEDTWLVASFRKVHNRFVEAATLGCPICSAEYPINDGIADFTAGITSPSCDAQRAAAGHRREELATRAGAFLDATEAGATMVLGGVWAYAAQSLAELTEVRVIALNPPEGVTESANVALVRVAADIPLAADSCRGAAVDAWFDAGIVAAAVGVVRQGGRVVGPAALPPPAELLVLAQDSEYWVAQKAPSLIPLHRASR